MTYSPVLALATAAFEAAGFFYALAFVSGHRGPVRRRFAGRGMRSSHRNAAIARTIAAILLLLAGYQVTEVAICADPEAAGALPRLAFGVVVWLPGLGLLLAAQLFQPRSRLAGGIATAALAAAAGLVLWIACDPAFATASVCNVVFARYDHALPRFIIYAVYYWLCLFAMLAVSGYAGRATEDNLRRRIGRSVFSGTAAFVAPSILVTRYVPPAHGALPSIMCHFALFLAVALVWAVRQLFKEESSRCAARAAEEPAR